VPSNADFDLYLYNSTGTSYGEPAIVAKSTNTTTGGQEQIILTVPYNGTYYLIVKRADSALPGGTFTLESTFRPNHEVTVLRIQPSSTHVYQGNTLNITVTVKNTGLNTESFNVTTFYNNTVTDTHTISSLAPGATTSFNSTLDTTEITTGNYTIKTQADTVPNEYNATDNTRVYDGLLRIKIPGDVNSDNTVDNIDLAQLRTAYGNRLGDPYWNPECDFNRDNITNVADLTTLGKNYGKTS